jgi:hypothetical protein
VRRSGSSGHSVRLALVLVAGAALVAGCSNGPAPKAAPKPAPKASTTTSSTGVPDTGAGVWSKSVPLAPRANLSVVSCAVVGLCLAASTTGQSYRMSNGSVSSLGPVGSAPSPQGASYLTCTAATFCVAVPNLNQVVQYDGNAWTAPVTIAAAKGFESVACVGTTWCVTIDGEGNSFVYDGGSWSGNVGAWGAANQISCVSPSFCVAVEGGTSVWNGSSWTQPGNDDNQGQLNSVSCASLSFCMAVDSAGDALTWNGTAFSLPALVAAEPALAGTDASGLTGVSCPTPTFCRAVDSIGRVFGFDGTTWSKGTLIDQGHALSSVSCPSVSYCVAVDRSGNAFVSAAATGTPNS